MNSLLTRWKSLIETDASSTVDPNGAKVAAYTAQLLLEKERKRRGVTAEVSEALHGPREDRFTDLLTETMGRNHA